MFDYVKTMAFSCASLHDAKQYAEGCVIQSRDFHALGSYRSSKGLTIKQIINNTGCHVSLQSYIIEETGVQTSCHYHCFINLGKCNGSVIYYPQFKSLMTSMSADCKQQNYYKGPAVVCLSVQTEHCPGDINEISHHITRWTTEERYNELSILIYLAQSYEPNRKNRQKKVPKAPTNHYFLI